MTKPPECENPIASRSETIVHADSEAGRKEDAENDVMAAKKEGHSALRVWAS